MTTATSQGPGSPPEAEAAVRLEVSESGIGWLVLDAPGQKVNILASAVMERMDELLDEVSDRSDIKALGVVSGKPGTFIAGADVAEIGGLESAAEAVEAARRGQSILHRLSGLGRPTLAGIDGVCLGGGLELALACSFRLATQDPKTRLGLPEVRLGIIPGFGGTQRLPKIVGLPSALDLILTGRTVDARRAERMGLVDEAVPAPYLRQRAEEWLRHAVDNTTDTARFARLKKRRSIPVSHRAMALPGIRQVVLRLARRRLDKTVTGVYPAPYVALDAVNAAFRLDIDAGLTFEADAVGPLIVSPTSKNLTWLFAANNDARREGSVTVPGSDQPVAARPVRRSVVLGAGVMGGGIALILAEKGIAVRMKDVNRPALVGGMKTAAGIVNKLVARRRIDRREGARRMGRIVPTLSFEGMKGAEIVVEAVVEDLQIKRNVLKAVEARVSDDCVFATNTSSLPIADIAEGARVPERVVGLHFFNPVHKMPLVEVIAGPESSPEALATAHGLARRLGKTPILVKDAPGFLVNRILTAYLAESLKMLVEGHDPVMIDKAMIHFGMPVGPFALFDQIGFDTGSKASRAIEALNEKFLPNVNVLPRLIEDGRLGAKNGRGFYRYKKERRRGFDRKVLELIDRGSVEDTPFEAVQARLYLPMVNESMRCLTAGVARRPADIDLGMIMGTGFPPFRGGPLRNADVIGVGEVVERLNGLADKYGERLAPDPALVEMALGGRRFYPES